MPKEIPRTFAEAIRLRDEMATENNPSQQRMAEVTRTAAMFDEAGNPSLLFRDTPWCNGAVWSLNPNPYLDSAATTGLSPPASNASVAMQILTNAATIHWNPAVRERLYGSAAKGRLDGEYLDSLEGYVTADLNFRREHFQHTTVPLTFDPVTHQPALFKGLAVFEFTKWMSDDVHRLTKLMFANGVPYRFAFLCPWLDILGTETDWLRGGQYQPASLSQMDFWRTLSGAKPYLLLMNTDYAQFTPELVARYFQRALFYGMFPSMFSHNASENPYWGNPKWYDRDRPLFKKYLPVIRQVAEAGWQPVTWAKCSNPKMLVERFGPGQNRDLFLTVYNPTDQQQAGVVSVETSELGLNASLQPIELLSRKSLIPAAPGWQIELPSQEVSVLHFSR